MIINRLETGAQFSPAATRPQLANGLATEIARAKTRPGISFELWKTANVVLGAVNVSNPSEAVAQDARDVLYHLQQAAARYKSPEQNVQSNGYSVEAPRTVLNDAERAKALAASIAAAQGSAGTLPVEFVGPVTPPLSNAETLTTLVHQPGAIGAAAIHDTLHPGSHN